ncbi:hypothetical protein HK102_012903 [Quaeritorhiza haematococci]|nr:hypothetical protein HK102_012903 [Quaeritorhiza haematococci]
MEAEATITPASDPLSADSITAQTHFTTSHRRGDQPLWSESQIATLTFASDICGAISVLFCALVVGVYLVGHSINRNLVMRVSFRLTVLLAISELWCK